MNWVKFKAQTQLNKKCSALKQSKIKGVPKLDDANDAGNAHQTEALPRASLKATALLLRRHGIIMLSTRWKELIQLHTDPH